MKISAKQLERIWSVFTDTLCIVNKSLGGMTQEMRIKLAEEIINQQSDELKEIE